MPCTTGLSAKARRRHRSGFEILIRIPIGNKEHFGTEAPGDKLPWSPLRPTVVCIFGVPIGLAVIEMSDAISRL